MSRDFIDKSPSFSNLEMKIFPEFVDYYYERDLKNRVSKPKCSSPYQDDVPDTETHGYV